MSPPRSPQEEKVRDYTHQRVNAYGQNDKASRDAIRARKRAACRQARRAARQAIHAAGEEWEALEEGLPTGRASDWEKQPDRLLLHDLDDRQSGSSRAAEAPHHSPLREEALRRLRQANKDRCP